MTMVMGTTFTRREDGSELELHPDRSLAADRSPRMILGFDTEDDGRGNPFLWCFTHQHGTWSTTHQGDAIQYVATLAYLKDRPTFWATNLEYDLVNLFGTERIREVGLRFGRSALCGASFRGVKFRDTVRHVPVGVAEWGAMLGLKKREARLFDPNAKRTARQYLNRCVRDATITYRAGVFLTETYAKLGLKVPKMTLASAALEIWRTQHWRREIHRPSAGVWRAGLGAYHGGRCQAFALGRFQDVKVIDAASMFPWAMTCAPLPLPWGLVRHSRRNILGSDLGLYRVSVRRLRGPGLNVLPVRTRAGTVYPFGRWEGWYVGEEVVAARARGYECKVLESYEFSENCRPFDSYIAKMFALKAASRGPARLMYKTLLNALYGKFSQQGRRVMAVPIERMVASKNPPLEWRPWCGLALYSIDAPAPPWSNNVWPAFITARARLRLLAEMEAIGRSSGRVLYCDTDSAAFQGDATYPSKAKAPGDFEDRGRFKEMLIVGKKEYALDLGRGRWEVHAKGIPESERMTYLRDGKASFERPVKIREGARSGETPNLWRIVTKQRRKKIATDRDGRVLVPEIQDEIVIP